MRTAPFPQDIQINAWANSAVFGEIDPTLQTRIVGRDAPMRKTALPVAKSSLKHWHKSDVGWGLVLPDNPQLSPDHRGTSIDAPEPIQELHAKRGGPVFRINETWEPGRLLQYLEDGTPVQPLLSANNIGMDPGHVPKYLLIVGGPDVIPWQVQYDLQYSHFTGRLDLDEAGLRNYVRALMNDWHGMTPNASNTLVWSVDHGKPDITYWLRRTIGKVLHKKFAKDADLALKDGAKVISKSEATHRALADGLRVHRPSLIATTCHGETWPLNDPATMRTHLGLLIDGEKARVDLSALSGAAAPAGAIWYAHACCSAGATGTSAYSDVLKPGSTAHDVVTAVTTCGEVIAPLPRTLLGAPRPLAAFVGHVEPTFDWTIRHPDTGQYLSNAIMDCFYQALFTGQPIGMALSDLRSTSGSLLTSLSIAEKLLREEGDTAQLGNILSLDLSAHDWQSVVLLGDPTVTVPP